MSSGQRGRICRQGLQSLLAPTKYREGRDLPLSSEVLTSQLRQRDHPHWTAWYVARCDVHDDLWGRSHFNYDVDGKNYQVLRTGAFPFIKFHCSRATWSNLDVEDKFFRFLKVANLGRSAAFAFYHPYQTERISL
jgi:hypothetical protein